MALSERLSRFLARKGITYQPLETEPVANLDAAVLASGKPQHDFIKATLLIDINGVVMVVHRFDSTLDMDAVHQFTGNSTSCCRARRGAGRVDVIAALKGFKYTNRARRF